MKQLTALSVETWELIDSEEWRHMDKVGDSPSSQRRFSNESGKKTT